jgi:hypothetical protein
MSNSRKIDNNGEPCHCISRKYLVLWTVSLYFQSCLLDCGTPTLCCCRGSDASKRKRRLFSNDTNFLDVEANLSTISPGSQDMFSVNSLGPGKKRAKTSREPADGVIAPILEESVAEPVSTLEFAAGLQVWSLE